jgi:benzodiazapine receptor
MGWAVGRVWVLGKHHRWGKTALYHFGVQLIFNGLWSIVFFGMQNPALALVVILILGVLIERTIKWFRLIDRLASRFLYPYFAWVCFATVLNVSIWYLN